MGRRAGEPLCLRPLLVPAAEFLDEGRVLRAGEATVEDGDLFGLLSGREGPGVEPEAGEGPRAEEAISVRAAGDEPAVLVLEPAEFAARRSKTRYSRTPACS